MRYLPKSPAEREQMLAEIGARSIDDLFEVIPAEYRLNRDLHVPRQQAESRGVHQRTSRRNVRSRVNGRLRRPSWGTAWG